MTESPPQNKMQRVTREELHTLVWQKPMIRLAEEFGVSGNGLAKICDRLDVPYPPRGYWAKKEAGKPVVSFRLPARTDGTPQTADIFRTPPKPAEPATLPEADEAAAIAAAKASGIAVPQALDELHPRVTAWITEHRRDQKEREQESRRHRRDAWWSPRLLSDLTDRDFYRFRVTSAVFKAVEKAGGRIEASPITGRVTFQVSGRNVDCSIVEKLRKSLKPRDETSKWTAYPDHHQSGLASSGFLRVSITTYLGGRQPQWIETDKIKIGDILPEIVGAIIAAGPILKKQQLEREEREKRYREEEVRRHEARRLREADEKRWNKFCELAASWEERFRLLVFLAEIERRASEEGEISIAGNSLGDWIAWAKQRTEALDPFDRGVSGVFEAVATVPQWG